MIAIRLFNLLTYLRNWDLGKADGGRYMLNRNDLRAFLILFWMFYIFSSTEELSHCLVPFIWYNLISFLFLFYKTSFKFCFHVCLLYGLTASLCHWWLDSVVRTLLMFSVRVSKYFFAFFPLFVFIILCSLLNNSVIISPQADSLLTAGPFLLCCISHTNIARRNGQQTGHLREEN